jgi:hypothetical protein
VDRTAWFRRLAVLIVGLPTVMVVLVAAASLVPDAVILDQLVGSVERSEIFNLPQVGISGRGLDVFSDCIALTMGLGDTDGGTATLWLRSPTLGSCEPTIESLTAFRDGDGLSGGYEYFRYWHGYTVVSRPLVAVVGVAGARIVLFWTFIAVTAGFARRLWRQHGAVAPLALLVPFLLTTDTVELARSTPHGVPAVVAMAGAWAVHRIAGDAGPDGADRWLRLSTVAWIGGAAYVFGDVLTTPPGAWALATCSAMLATAGRGSLARTARAGGFVCAAWIVGWTWTWVSKWVIAAVVLGWDAVRDNVGDAIDERLAGDGASIDLGPFNAVRMNVETWLDHPLTPAVLIAVAVATAVLWRSPNHRSTWRMRLLLATPALLPLVWFEVLRNHSLVHPLFVYRSVGVTAGIVALALLVDSAALRRGGPVDERVDVEAVPDSETAT